MGLIRGFLSETQLKEALKTNQICLLPYKTHPEHSVYGSSGASKIAIAYIPTIVGDCHLFDDLRTIGIPSATTAKEIANHVDKLFSHSAEKKILIDKQYEYCIQNSWANIAKQYAKTILAN